MKDKCTAKGCGRKAQWWGWHEPQKVCEFHKDLCMEWDYEWVRGGKKLRKEWKMKLDAVRIHEKKTKKRQLKGYWRSA